MKVGYVKPFENDFKPHIRFIDFKNEVLLVTDQGLTSSLFQIEDIEIMFEFST